MADVILLKQLREETGVSFSLCKKALDQSNNDVEKAKKLLSAWGVEKAISKAGRSTLQGALFSYIHHNKRVGVLFELLCETDFVAKNADFQQLGNYIAQQIASTNPATAEDLLQSEFIRDPSKTIDQIIKDTILKIGENIKVGKFVRYEI